jgi:hypothetical protein
MLVILPSPILELQHAFLPLQSAASQRACFDSLLFRYFQFRLTFESIKEFGSVSMAFHGLIDHVKDYFICELSLIWKNNLATLAKDLPPYANF